MSAEHDTVGLLSGEDPLGIDEAFHLLRLLVPILDTAPHDEEAQSAASSVIRRMPYDSAATAMLDWWFVVTTGTRTPPLGLAYTLPDSIDESLRNTMAETLALGNSNLNAPVAQWIRESRALPERLLTIDTLIDLDSYGRSKLPSERDVWAWFVLELDPTIEALRHERRCDTFTFDDRQLDRELEKASLVQNSRRWKEMRKRIAECTAGINALVESQGLAAPWLGLNAPQALDAVPAAGTEALGDLATQVFEILIDTDQRLARSQADIIAEECEAIASGLNDVQLAWWSTIFDGWLAEMRTDGHQVQMPIVEQVIERRDSIRQEIAKLQGAGVDTDTAVLLLLDHDLAAAEQVIGDLKQQQVQDRRSEALSQRLAKFRRLASSDQPVPSNWLERVTEAEAALDSGDFETANLSTNDLERDLRQARRADEIAELSELRETLTDFAAPAAVITELDEHLDELAGDETTSVNDDLRQRLNDRLHALQEQRQTELEDYLAQVRALLDGAGDSIADADRSDLDLKLVEIESADLPTELMKARRLSIELLTSIQDKRVYRWNRSEGEQQLVDHVLSYCTQEFDYSEDDVRRLYVAAKTKPFVILAGLTGSGKSTIARLFAAALGADAASKRFRRVAVKPDWIDQSDVLGMINPMSNRFEPGWLAVVARQCEQNLDQIHVVLLDEMNLAPVEQYFAEYLSALEEARSGFNETQLPLYGEGAEPANADEWPSSLPFPRNLIVIGTVNVDETTRALSERVLDRANVLQLSVTTTAAHHGHTAIPVRPWYVPFSEWREICITQPDPGHHDFLVELAEILETIGIGVGARAHIELERFLANASGILDPNTALDLGVLQRIIPKIRGFKRDLVDGLEDLQEALENRSCDRSARIVSSWLGDSVSDDEFLDGTDTRIGLLS